jgi:L-seryl-tRNA(Ser) seleniumtransferase
VGNKDILAAIRKNPLTRALRIDKLTLAALEITLREYRDSDRAVETTPTLKMMTAPVAEVAEKCQRLLAMLKDTGDARLKAEIVDGVSRAGGGSFPQLEIPTRCLSIEIAGLSPDKLESALRGNRPPVIGRIEKEMFLMDLRTVAADELLAIRDAFLSVLNR